MKEISQQNIKNTGQCIPLGYILSLFVQEKYVYIYIYIVPIRFRTVFSKYFLTLISHDFHPLGWLPKIYSTDEREKKDRPNKFKANLINHPLGIIPHDTISFTSSRHVSGFLIEDGITLRTELTKYEKITPMSSLSLL